MLKRLNLILSFVLIIILIFSMMVTGFATDNSISAQLDNLYRLCTYTVDVYGIDCDKAQFPVAKDREFLKLSYGEYEIKCALLNAYALLNDASYFDHDDKNDNVTSGMIKDAVSKINSATENARVLDTELKILVDLCLCELNDDGYYDTKLFSQFESQLNICVSILEKTDAEYEEINAAYWDLLDLYNQLCVSNSLYGDICGNGIVDVIDATKLQYILAGLSAANSSQKLVCNMNILYATGIQLYLAKYTDSLPKLTTGLDTLSDNLTKSDINSKNFDFDSWRNNPLYNKYRISNSYNDELIEYAHTVSKTQNSTTLTMTVMSDTHYSYDGNYASQKISTAYDMSKLANYIEVNYMVNLGDMVNGNTDKSTTLKNMNEIIDATNRYARCPVLYVRGNHDDNGWYSYEGEGNYLADEMINNSEWAEHTFNTSYQSGVVVDKNNPDGCYGYIDHEDSKIRVFILNSVDIPYILNDDGIYRYDSYEGYAFSNEQLNFVAKSLMFEDKSNPQEWAAMFLTHVPLDTTNDDGYRFGGTDSLIRGHNQMLSIISAYKNGASASFSGSVYDNALGDNKDDFLVEYDVDYSHKGVGEVIGFVNGHTHTDNASKSVGYENSLSNGYAYIGVVGSNAFSTLVIDREQRRFSVFKYGKTLVETNKGTINGQQELSVDIASGKYSFTYDQFVPQGENLYTGVALDNTRLLYKHEDKSNGFDSVSYVPFGVESKDGYAVSKVIAVKPLTTYVMPKEFVGNIALYRRPVLFVTDDNKYMRAGRQADIQIVEYDNYCTVTTDSLTSYLAVGFDTVKYSGYNSFYLKELYADIK